MSVRSLYTPPAEEWVFLPPTVPAPNSSSSASAPAHLPTPFSPASAESSSLDYGPLQLFAAEYFTTALGMPFEVGKTLLQLEYRPRARFAPAIPDIPPIPQGQHHTDEYASDDEDGAYFSDLPPRPPREAAAPGSGGEVDDKGYFPDLDPTWLLKDDPDISRGNGVWGMIRRVRATPSEGLPGLWKGQIVSTIHSLLSTILQPQIHSSLSLLAPSPDLPLSALPSPALPLAIQVGSHLIAHLILSPLELLRTRLIAMPTRSDTPSSITLFNRMVEREGGLAAIYLHSTLLIPAVLEHSLRPLLTLSIPLLLERQLHISPDLSPITYSLCDLSLNLASLLILLPIETVRKRLQVQHRGPPGDASRIKTVVRTREAPYVGVVEAIWRIVTEETGVRRRRVMTEKEEGGVFAGIRQLYRGFGMAATAHVTVFSLGLVSASLGGRGFDGGWKEI